MKITDPQIIEDGEKDLIEAVQEDLDLDAVRQILRDRMGVSTLSSKGGQIVVHNNEIAFRLDFDINLSGSLLFDREGNYINDSEEDTTLDPEMDQELDPELALNGLDVDASLIHDELEDPLNEIPLVDTGLDETDLDEEDPDEEFSIDLPEYDLEDEPEYEPEPTDQDDTDKLPLDLETEDLLPDESDQATELSSIPEANALDTENLENENLENENLENQDLEDDSLLQEEKLDEDINDILKESREFWEQKKDS